MNDGNNHVFHFFFIPLFKWNEKYYIECRSCKRLIPLSNEKGKKIERGENIEITGLALEEVNNIYGYNYNANNICKSCKKEVDSEYKYCPYCGYKVK